MSERILIVDDDPVQRRLLDNMVRKSGYEPLLAETGEQAVAMLSGPGAQRVDCVVLDLVMPDLDGLGVLARLRENGINLPVIVQTAHGGIDNVISAMRAGAMDFVVKPVGAERLQVSIRNALDKGALEGELARVKRSRDGTLTGCNVLATRQVADHAKVEVIASGGIGSLVDILAVRDAGLPGCIVGRALYDGRVDLAAAIRECV